jgi:putative spermidine/putrescine transport system ATP-binding protein
LAGGRQPIEATASSATAIAMIRPETIGIVEVGSVPLSGVIDSISFIGDRQRMVVSGVSNRPLTIDAPNTIRAQIGEKVGLSIAPNAVRLLPPES